MSSELNSPKSSTTSVRVFNLKYKPGEFNLRVEGSDRIVYSQHKEWCSTPYWQKVLRGMLILDKVLFDAEMKKVVQRLSERIEDDARKILTGGVVVEEVGPFTAEHLKELQEKSPFPSATTGRIGEHRIEWPIGDRRIDYIGQNGPDGEVYKFNKEK